MSSIVAIIQFYNDLDGMKRLYDSLHEYGIDSIWVDGRFKVFTKINNSDQSTDGSREFIKSKPDATLCTLPVMFEYDSKSILLEKARDYDYAIQFGCDEYPVGDFDELVRNLDEISDGSPAVYRVNAVIDKADTTGRLLTKNGKTEKIFCKPHRIKCHNTHWSHFIDSSDAPYRSLEKAVGGITIHHDQSIRESSREELMDKYQKIQYFDERQKYYIHKNKIKKKPSMEGLNILFPFAKIIENDTNFMIKDDVNASKLPLNWVRCKTTEGLCVMK